MFNNTIINTIIIINNNNTTTAATAAIIIINNNNNKAEEGHYITYNCQETSKTKNYHGHCIRLSLCQARRSGRD
jgi:hypothetical protein